MVTITKKKPTRRATPKSKPRSAQRNSGKPGYYLYRYDAPLGREPLAGDQKSIWYDLTTDQGAIRRAKSYFKSGPLRLYRFTDFYKSSTFRLIFSR